MVIVYFLLVVLSFQFNSTLEHRVVISISLDKKGFISNHHGSEAL